MAHLAPAGEVKCQGRWVRNPSKDGDVALMSLTLDEKRERPALGLSAGVLVAEGYRGGFHGKLLEFSP